MATSTCRATASGPATGPALRLALTALLMLVAPPVLADPCCLNLTCVDLAPGDCSAQGGRVGYCVIGEACGRAACDAARILPIAAVVAAKSSDRADVELSWQPDVNADGYDVWYVTAKQDLPACPACPGALPVAGSTPTLIARGVHRNAVAGPAGQVFFHDVSGRCDGAAAARGACCTGTTCRDGQDPAQCAAAGGRYRGDGSTCAATGCPPTGACCSGVVCIEGLTEAECPFGFLPGVSCVPDPCSPAGACCNPGGCRDNRRMGECMASGGTYLGPGTVCAGNPCAGACCAASGCTTASDSPSCNASGGIFAGAGSICADACRMPLGACCLPSGCRELSVTLCTASGGRYAGDYVACASNPC